MEIIPVIDIREGHAVHAVAGKRRHYQALRTPLCAGSHPSDIVRAFIKAYSFRNIYLADLDAIEKKGNNSALIQNLGKSFRHVNFWVDQGENTPRLLASSPRFNYVIGSETMIAPGALRTFVRAKPELILSLDFDDKKLRGDNTLLQMPQSWPDRVIVMSLTHVGAARGPDYELLENLRGIAGQRQLFAAGGVRHHEDLRALSKLGIQGALIATALHEGTLMESGRPTAPESRAKN